MDCIVNRCICDTIICNNEVEHQCNHDVALKITDTQFMCAQCLRLRINNEVYTIIDTVALNELHEEIKHMENSIDFFENERRYTH